MNQSSQNAGSRSLANSEWMRTTDTEVSAAYVGSPSNVARPSLMNTKSRLSLAGPMIPITEEWRTSHARK
jgi:hypothetical protein